MSTLLSSLLSSPVEELVEEFVRVVRESGRTPEDVVAGVEGLSGRNARRYVEEGFRPSRVTKDVRRAMADIIVRNSQDAGTRILEAKSVREPAPEYGNGVGETDRRLREILDSDRKPLEQSELIIDLAIALRADAFREREVRARVEAEAYRSDAETNARRQQALAAERTRAAEEAERRKGEQRAAATKPSQQQRAAEGSGGGP